MFKYLEVLFRHWFRFAALCVALPVLAGGLGLVVFQGKDGSAQIWVDTPSYIGNIETASGWNQYLTPAQNTVDSMTQLFMTTTFYAELGQSLIDSGSVKDADQEMQVLNDVRGSLGATATGSHLVTVKVECRAADVCVQVLSTTIAQYRQWLVDTEKQQAAVASQFYTSQLDLAKQKLQTAIDAYKAYLAAHQVPANTVRPPDPVLDRLDADVQQAQTQVNTLQDKLQSIQLSRDAAAEIDQTALRVVDPPTTSSGHFTSVTKKMAILIAAGAALPGIAYVIFLGWIDRSARNPKEIEGRLGTRVVVTIGSLDAKRA